MSLTSFWLRQVIMCVRLMFTDLNCLNNVVHLVGGGPVIAKSTKSVNEEEGFGAGWGGVGRTHERGGLEMRVCV